MRLLKRKSKKMEKPELPAEQFQKKIEKAMDETFLTDEAEKKEEKESVKKKMEKKELSLEECCEQLIAVRYQLDEKKLEYEQVTAYLSDIQRIDQITPQEREELEAIAVKIVMLSEDRKEMKQDVNKLTQLQFKFMQLHEDDIEEGISHITEQEKRQNDIRQDLQKLDNERNNLKQEEHYYLQKLSNLKMITLSALFLAIIAAGIVGFFYIQYEFDILFVYLIIVFILAIIGTMLFVKYRNVNYALAYCRKQQNRAVTLMNKVKLKSVNNISTLDYLYEKYNVGSARELSFLWEQYQEILANEEKYKRSSKELTSYGDQLVKLLSNIGVHDADIWIYQAQALLDSREMVEVTHNLNVRRKKLREEMEYDEDWMDLAINGIRHAIEQDPKNAFQAQSMLAPHHITI